jgi:hypothetical protein
LIDIKNNQFGICLHDFVFHSCQSICACNILLEWYFTTNIVTLPLHTRMKFNRGTVAPRPLIGMCFQTVAQLGILILNVPCAKWVAISTKSLEQLNITGKVKECNKTVYSDYNLYSCRFAEEESKHLLFPCHMNIL